jgi:Yip1 domain
MNLVERVKAILLAPKTEWPVIEREPGDPAYLFANYVAILAAIPAVCGLIGGVIAGLPVGAAIVAAIVRYALTFAFVYIIALIVDALAPTFGSQKNFANALRLAAYTPTAYWVAGVFLLIPALRILTALAGLYGFYLLWTGLPPLMKVPEDKAIGYTAAVVVAGIVVGIVITVVLAALIGVSL